MPSSLPDNISVIMKYVIRRSKKEEWKSILDIGVGCGKYGLLFREYLDGHWTGSAFHDKSKWKMQIDGCEAFQPYITPAHKYIYNNIYNCSVQNIGRVVLPMQTYDMIFMGDVIEHFPLQEGINLVGWLRERFKPKCFIISTPNFQTNFEKKVPFGNDFESHRSLWTMDEFNKLGRATALIHDPLLTVVLEN